MKPVDILETPLLRLTPWDNFRLRDAVQGVCVMGGIGSGKTSGTGKSLAGAYLRAGMGGLVLCAKPEEVELWKRYCAQHGRSDSLIVVDLTQGYNFLAHELSRQHGDGVNAVIEVLMRVLEMARASSPTPGRSGDQFWEDTTKQILRHAVPVLYAATGTVRIEDLLRFVRSAPHSPDQMRDPAWQAQSWFCSAFAKAAPKLPDAIGERLVSYWRNDFATLDAKTRGNILISLTTTLDRFNHGWLRAAFCQGSSVLPEMTFQGAVILLAMPALTFNEDGILAQQIWKFMFQRAVLSRNGLAPNQRNRPVFLWADEAQYFVGCSQDADFLSTCRGSLCCTVFLSQSLPTYFAKVGGDNARDRVFHLLGNFGSKVWHNAGGCSETAEWASRTLGKGLVWRENYSQGEGSGANYGMGMNEGSNVSGSHGSGGSYSRGGNGQGQFGTNWNSGSSWGESEGRNRNRGTSTTRNSSRGASQQNEFILEPGALSRGLKTGGPAHRNRVSAVWYQAGRRWNTSGTNVIVPEFEQ